MSARPLVIIPAYNAEKSLGELLHRLSRLPGHFRLLVVNDGSTDATARIAESHAVDCLTLAVNRGKGAAIRAGLTFAEANGFSTAITIDADLQHDPDLVPSFAAVGNPEALVLGRRNLSDRSMPLLRQSSNLITSLLISIRAGHVVHDSQCGFRRLPVKAALAAPVESDRFTYESELLLHLLLQGHPLVEIEIPTMYGAESTSISGIRDTLKFAGMLWRSCWW